jgi:hypothetical protein
MRSLLFSAWLLLWMASCDGPSKSVPSTGRQDSTLSADTSADAASTPPALFDPETAETLTAMHFSELNREAKYQRYKGLLVDIDTIFPSGPDGSQRFRALVWGRRWENPSRDTTTRPYQDTISFMATWEGRNWSARVSNQ